MMATLEADILAEQQFDPETSERRFVISTSDIGELVFLPRLMAELSRRARGITLQSCSMSPEELERAMAGGSVDLALG